MQAASNDLDLFMSACSSFFLLPLLKSDNDTRASYSHSRVLSVGRSPSLPPPLCFRNRVSMSHRTSHVSSADSVVHGILFSSYMYMSHASHTLLCLQHCTWRNPQCECLWARRSSRFISKSPRDVVKNRPGSNS